MVYPGNRDIDANRTCRDMITGADSGIGRYSALALAKYGCDIGSMVRYLANDETQYVTGCSYDVGGGLASGNRWSWRGIRNRPKPIPQPSHVSGHQ